MRAFEMSYLRGAEMDAGKCKGKMRGNRGCWEVWMEGRTEGRKGLFNTFQDIFTLLCLYLI